MIRRFLVFAFYFLIIIISDTHAQYQDFKTWWAVNLTKELRSDLDLRIQAGQRFDENSLQFERSLFTAGLRYDISNSFRLDVACRYNLQKDIEEGFYSKYRLNGDVTYSYEAGDFNFKIRERLQYFFKGVSEFGDFYENKLTSRSRVGADYNIFGTPLRAHASAEIFVHVNSASGMLPDAYRLRGGLVCSITSRSDVDVSYIREREFNVKDPLTSHVFFVSYSYKL